MPHHKGTGASPWVSGLWVTNERFGMLVLRSGPGMLWIGEPELSFV